MTPALKAELDKLEAENVALLNQYNPRREAYDKLVAQLSPLLEQQLALEAEMDQLKPRLAELDRNLPSLRAAVNGPTKPPVEKKL
jgi:chromosome segregation ATPase